MEGLDLRKFENSRPFTGLSDGDRFVARVNSKISDEAEKRVLAKLKQLAKAEVRVLVIDCSSFEVAILGSQKILLGGRQYLSISQPGVMNLGISKISIREGDFVAVRVLTEAKRYTKGFISKVRDWAHPCDVTHFQTK